jgi:Cu+-exporting ATPase
MEDLDHVALLTGDNDAEQSNLEALLPKGTDMRFRQSPHEKLSFVQGWQAEGKQVAMVGDGLNDAGALAVSDVGISIADDAFHFAPACDILLQGDKLPDLPAIQAMAKSGMQVVRANIGLSLAYNAIGLTFAVQGLLTPIVAAILMPVSSLSVVALSFVLTQRAKAKHLHS